MLVAKEGPKEAASWYIKTNFISFFSLLMFFVLFGVFYYISLSIMNSGTGAIVSLISSLILTFSFFIYYNKRHIKEWKKNNDKKQDRLTSYILPSLLIGSFILFALLTFIFESPIIKITGRVVMVIVFLLYIYFKFLKK